MCLTVNPDRLRDTIEDRRTTHLQRPGPRGACPSSTQGGRPVSTVMSLVLGNAPQVHCTPSRSPRTENTVGVVSPGTSTRVPDPNLRPWDRGALPTRVVWDGVDFRVLSVPRRPDNLGKSLRGLLGEWVVRHLLGVLRRTSGCTGTLPRSQTLPVSRDLPRVLGTVHPHSVGNRRGLRTPKVLFAQLRSPDTSPATGGVEVTWNGVR